MQHSVLKKLENLVEFSEFSPPNKNLGVLPGWVVVWVQSDCKPKGFPMKTKGCSAVCWTLSKKTNSVH